MPSPIHTTLVDLLDAHPETLAYLLELGGEPPAGPLVPATGTRTKTFTLERRVDRAYLVGSPRAPTGFILAEIQLAPDDDKRRAWPLYVELARSRHACEGALVVLTVARRVRRWIRRRIVPPTGQLGSLRQLKPKVLALDRLDPALLLRPDRPYLAPLAVAARAGRKDVQRVAETAVALTLEQLPERLAADQLDAILGMVNDALRAHLETRIMVHREYRSELFRGIYKKGEAEGKAEGEAKGKAESILAVLAARGIPVSETIRQRILGCTDLATLDAWLPRAVVVATAAGVVRAKAPPRARAPRRTAKA
ncbi:Hypothetical protein A7982_02595 [Minicystis rosea]|nr:Hypothetical protein A7982_02595 [Minicystis rosea]